MPARSYSFLGDTLSLRLEIYQEKVWQFVWSSDSVALICAFLVCSWQTNNFFIWFSILIRQFTSIFHSEFHPCAKIHPKMIQYFQDFLSPFFRRLCFVSYRSSPSLLHIKNACLTSFNNQLNTFNEYICYYFESETIKLLRTCCKLSDTL